MPSHALVLSRCALCAPFSRQANACVKRVLAMEKMSQLAILSVSSESGLKCMDTYANPPKVRLCGARADAAGADEQLHQRDCALWRGCAAARILHMHRRKPGHLRLYMPRVQMCEQGCGAAILPQIAHHSQASLPVRSRMRARSPTRSALSCMPWLTSGPS